MADFLRQVDIANLLGVSKQRAHQLARHETFPPPVRQQGRGARWRKADIAESKSLARPVNRAAGRPDGMEANAKPSLVPLVAPPAVK